jgi:hypothetical protein
MKTSALALVPHVPWTLFGMLLFLTVFIVLVIRVLCTSKETHQQMADMPLDDERSNS